MPTQPAILGTMRLGNFRLGYESAALAALRRTRVTVLIAGVLANARVRVGSLTVRDVLNDAPNTAAFLMDGTAPVDGQDVRISVNSDTPRLLFNGTLQATDLTYEGRGTQTAFPCRAIDDIARLNQRRPFGTWVDVSVTTIAQHIIATFAPGFTSVHVQASLPTVSITFDGSEEFSACLSRLATAIGGYFYVEDLDLHLFQTEATDVPDTLDTTPGRFEDDPPISVTTDRTNLMTRVYAKGHGEQVPVDVLSGETVIPIDDAVMFNAAGGKAIAGTTPDGAQSQILTYAGVQLGGAGAVVGVGVTPSTPPALALATGAGLSAGVYQYESTWVTAVGESAPSPAGTITTVASETISDPTVAPVVTGDNFGIVIYGGGPNFNASSPATSPKISDTVQYAYSYSMSPAPSDLLRETNISPGSNIYTVVRYDPYFATYGWTAATLPKITLPSNADPRIKYYHVWRKRNGGAWLSIANFLIDASGSNGFVIQDSSIDGATSPPVANPLTLERKQVNISGVTLGPTGTTSRNVYRTTVGGSQFKLQQTIANNTATTGVTDVTADGSLGANAPTSDTAGLVGVGTGGQGFYTTASVAFSTDGAATLATTSAPVFTAATYTFIAADVGATIYIKSGANWTVGRYLIVSVAGGAATLQGACASVSSPTAATWGIDYSALATPRFTWTDLAIDPTASTKITSAAQPFGSNVLGNVIVVAFGVGFVPQRVIALSIGGSAVLTCDKSIGTLSATAGQGAILGATAATQVNAGSTSIPTAGTGPFSSAGGWVSTSSGALVRYAGISGNTLTGIPVSGIGMITTTIPYGSQVIAAPALTGVTGLTLAMQKSAKVHIWVQRDDLAAQAALIAIDAAQGRVSDGVVEGPPIVDERRGEASLTALCDANLALFSAPIVTVTYATRDTKTKSGKQIVVNLTNPPISQTLTIQEVLITDIDVAPNTDAMGLRCAPKFMVTASSVRFSLEDLLRRLAE